MCINISSYSTNLKMNSKQLFYVWHLAWSARFFCFSHSLTANVFLLPIHTYILCALHPYDSRNSLVLFTWLSIGFYCFGKFLHVLPLSCAYYLCARVHPPDSPSYSPILFISHYFSCSAFSQRTVSRSWRLRCCITRDKLSRTRQNQRVICARR